MQPNSRIALLFSIVTILSGAAGADNAITQIQVQKVEESTIVKVEMRDPVKAAPGYWSIVEPPRLVFDFPDTQNLTDKAAYQKAKAGDVKSLSLVQVDSLTRLVLNLNRATAFTTEVDGNAINVRLTGRGGTADQSPSSRVLNGQYVAAPAKFSPTDGMNGAIREIQFKRGEEGDGVITLELSDGTLPMDIQRTPTGLAVNLSDVELPPALQARHEVVDFATPITRYVAQQTRTGTRLDVDVKGLWFHNTHVANNILTIKVSPITAQSRNKLVHRGQDARKVSINFYDAEATMVLRTLAEISGKNILIDPSLSLRKVTVSLENIPYDQALDIVMAQVNATMRIRDSVVTFGDRNAMAARDRAEFDDLQKIEEIAPIEHEKIQLSFVKAEDVEALISRGQDFSSSVVGVVTRESLAQAQKEANINETNAWGDLLRGTKSKGPSTADNRVGEGGTGMLTPGRGSIHRYAQEQILYVSDTRTQLDKILKLIKDIDRPPRQVMIEARLVSAETGFSRNLGMRLGVNDLSNTVAGQGIGQKLIGGTFAVAGRSTADLITATGQNSASRIAPTTPFLGPSIDLANGAATNTFAVSVFNAGLTKFINLELQAGEDQNKVKNISTPRIVTANNKEATILKGTQVAYMGSSGTGGPSVTFQNATLTLKVKPQITANGTVILNLDVTNDELGPTTSNGQPSILKSQIKTEVTVENGGTTVLGGVLKETSSGSEQRIPFLSDIPYIGKFFKSTSTTARTEELLVFITPRILNETIGQAVTR